MGRRYGMVVAVLVGLLFVGSLLLNVAYTQHVQDTADRRQAELRREGDQRWCALFEALDRPVPSTIKDPVQRARSEQAVRLFHQLRVDLGCV
jgi:hypothetical protein